jgi:hypothetical protein
MAVGLWLLLALAGGALDASELRTLAASSQRPALCASDAVTRAGLWSAARSGTTRQYCLTLARGYTRLDEAPDEALALAQQAQSFARQESAVAADEAVVLAGRAELRLGEFVAAYSMLSSRVRARGRPLGDLAALRELGVAAALTRHWDEAALAYRALLPRTAFERDPEFARRVSLEAGSVLMATGASGLADALQFLSDARRRPVVPGSEDLLVAFLALALDRSGQLEAARALEQELQGPWSLERYLTARDRARLAQSAEAQPELPALKFDVGAPMLAEGELHAAIAVIALRSDPRLARQHLLAYLAAVGADGRFAAWARERLASLRHGAGT